MGRSKQILAVFFLLFSGAYLAAAWSLPLGHTGKPGPGLIPVSIAVPLTVFSLLHVREAFFPKGRPRGKKEEEGDLPREDLLRVIGVAAFLVLYMLLLSPVGYALMTVLMVAGVLRFLGVREKIRTGLVAVLASGLSYYFFTRILDVPLPRGILPF